MSIEKILLREINNADYDYLTDEDKAIYSQVLDLVISQDSPEVTELFGETPPLSMSPLEIHTYMFYLRSLPRDTRTNEEIISQLRKLRCMST